VGVGCALRLELLVVLVRAGLRSRPLLGVVVVVVVVGVCRTGCASARFPVVDGLVLCSDGGGFLFILSTDSFI
jgi:hypothetical protein